jgi:glycosyltransferase involved in cell wall biosynthesis
MADVAVYHDDLTLRGGGESVCMHALDGLARAHDVTLFTRVQPDLPALNEYYDTAVSGVRVVTFADLHPLGRPLSAAGRLADRLTGRSLRRFRRAAFVRSVARAVEEFDAALDTTAQGLPGAVVYQHKPRESDGLRPWLTAALGGKNGLTGPETKLLTNSEWTADEIAKRTGVRPTVVYPPVRTDELGDGAPWGEREHGFVALGRISPEKRVLRSIGVVERLRERGHDVHLHVVGPVHDADYARRVRERADGEAVRYEGRLPRGELVELLRTHRYGIHGREAEHFGIGVAEMVATGMVPFVPDSGGQREIVGGDDRLTYGSAEEAAERAASVLSRPDAGEGIRDALPDIEERFGCARFRRRIRAAIDAELPTVTRRAPEQPA